MAEGHTVEVFAPQAAHTRLTATIPCLKDVSVIDFSTNTSPTKLRAGVRAPIDWITRLPSLDAFNRVYCDNLPEILLVRPDAAIMAQFFWHQSIDGVSPEYVDLCESLLMRIQPVVLGCGRFAMDHVRTQPRFRTVRMVENPHLLSAARAHRVRTRSDLLISGGSTDEAEVVFRPIVNRLLETGFDSDGVVHVDARLIPANPPAWMQLARFDVRMFLSLKAAICRPGLGVVTDLLTVGIVPVPVYEAGNQEMIHNAAVLNSISTVRPRSTTDDASLGQALENVLKQFHR